MNATATPLDELYKLVGRRVREARESRGLSQQRLAEEVDLTRTSITNIESGRQKLLLHTVFLLADALATPVNDLIAPPTTDMLEQSSKLAKAHVPDGVREWVLNGVKTSVADSQR